LTLIHSLAFILGFSMVFIALGATATAAGQFLREHQDTLRIAGGILIVFFGIYLTGIIQIPFLSRERKVHLSGKPLGVLGSILVGITFAAGWTPCIGPILASILLYASTAKTVVTGILLLSDYSLGLGVPFLLASLGMNAFLAASSRLRQSLRTTEAMATKTRATNRPTVAHAAETLPGALALLNGLDQVARSLVPFEAGGTSLAQVVEGARRLLNPDGVAILIRDKDGEYTFMAAEGVLAEWRQFVLAGSGVELLDEFLKRDTVTPFQRKQRTAWAREFLFA